MKQLDIASFSTPGLYLLFPDEKRLVLTREGIEKTTRALLDDPDAIPPHVRKATDYKPCSNCPERDTAEICHAIMPTLPFFDDIDRYMSYDRVSAVYREEGEAYIVASDTTMQDALQFVTILSLMHYCEVGQQYEKFFRGVNPLMSIPSIGKAVFLNIYLAAQGDTERAKAIIDSMSRDILETAKCQTARLRLISARDAFLNAFVNTELITHFVVKELNTCIAEMHDRASE